MKLPQPDLQPAPRAALSREKGPVFSLKATLWKLRTAAHKKWIGLQDRMGLYSYRDWIRSAELPGSVQADPPPDVSDLAQQPLISALIVVGAEAGGALQVTLQSLLAQTYANWEACLVATSGEVARAVAGLAQEEGRLRSQHWHPGAEQPHPLAAALDMAAGEFVLRLNPGDTLAPRALQLAVQRANADPRIDVIYSDEDRLTPDGIRRDRPFFKPDWSPELLLSTNYLAHAVFRRSLMQQAASHAPPGGVDLPTELVFRCAEMARQICHVPQVLYHEKGSLAGSPDRGETTADLHCRSVEAHLHRLGIPAAQARVAGTGTIQVTWPVASEKVSIIIPTRDHVSYLRRCIESIRRLTDHPDYEFILVDSGSREAETRRYYAGLNEDPTVRIVDFPGSFNFSAALNLGARHAQGDILLFLNNDTEAVDSDWLAELARWASRPEVGVVGAQLLYPDGALQHAGIVVGLEGHGSHVFAGQRSGYAGIFGSVDWYRNYSAVTGACMAIRQDVFADIGGFDEDYELVFSDIEICLRAIAAGYRVVYTPFARLIHHEGRTRYRHIPSADIRLGHQHFNAVVENGDPFYNPNLSYAVRTPTFRRPNDETPIARLEKIVQFAG